MSTIIALQNMAHHRARPVASSHTTCQISFFPSGPSRNKTIHKPAKKKEKRKKK